MAAEALAEIGIGPRGGLLRWIEATGAPYAEGIGPNGQVRPPMLPLPHA